MSSKIKKITYQTRHGGGPPILPGVEVFCPKTIIIKQYLSTNNISINNTHFVIKSSQTTGMSSKMEKIEYQTCRVRSCFNHVIELNQKMLNFQKNCYKECFFM
jgi:hypothetical protein